MQIKFLRRMNLEMFLNLCSLILILATAHGFPSENNYKRCLNYCSAGGICVVEEGVPQCHCLPEWSGQRCDQPRALKKKTNDAKAPLGKSTLRNTACSAVPGLCANGGACQFDPAQQEYSCVCSDDYYGTRCENTSRKFRSSSFFLSSTNWGPFHWLPTSLWSSQSEIRQNGRKHRRFVLLSREWVDTEKTLSSDRTSRRFSSIF